MPFAKRLRLFQENLFHDRKIIIGRAISLSDEEAIGFHVVIRNGCPFLFSVEVDDVFGRN